MADTATVQTKPFVLRDHIVNPFGRSLVYYRAIHQPFIDLMASLYPHFASYRKAETGWSAFTREGVFIGSFAGQTLQSVRRNPVLDDQGRDLFLRALLGGMHLDGYTHHQSVCDPRNYGTLRLWQKLWLGAKLDAKGKARSALRTQAAHDLLTELIAKAKPDYADHRRYAEKRLLQIDVPRFLPTPDTFAGAECRRLDIGIG